MCYPFEFSFVYNAIKPIKPLESIEDVKPLGNYAREVFKMDINSQTISYNDKIIVFYNFLKKKRIVVSWMNDITVDKLNIKPNEIINALKKIYFDYQIAFFDEKDLV